MSSFFLLLFTTACTRKDDTSALHEPLALTLPVKAKLEEKRNEKDRALLRLSRMLAQADAVHREAWWVVAAERKVQGKSVFGKAQRALLLEMGEKLADKTLFSCDRYFVKREILSPGGIPQKGEIFEQCRANNTMAFADYEIKSENEAQITFYPQHLSDVVGLATSILNRKIRCKLVATGESRLEALQCENMAQDRSISQSIQFSVYRYERVGQNLITLKGEVFENLSPIRKIAAKVPLAGKISVVETQVEAPEGYGLKEPDVPVPAQSEQTPSMTHMPRAVDSGPIPAGSNHGDLPQLDDHSEDAEAPSDVIFAEPGVVPRPTQNQPAGGFGR